MRTPFLFSCLILLIPAAVASAGTTWYADPAQGAAGNNGTKNSPWPGLEQLIEAGLLERLQAGDTLLLRNGNHGRAVFSGDNDDFVTIAADEGHKPALSYLEITRGSKWRLKRLTISATFADESYSGVMLKVADGGPSSEIIVEDCFVYSTLDTSTWSAGDWMKANSGMFMGRYGSGHVFRNNYVFNTRFGISLCAEQSVCEGNVVSHFSADGIRVTRDGQMVQHNVIRNIYVSDADGDSNHDDAIQCFLFNKGTGTVRNVTVRENLIVMRENEEQKWPANMQAIGFFDGPLIGFLVQGNVINTSHWHGVSLYDAQDCRILDNVAYTQWTESNLRPWVELGSKNSGAVQGNEVKNNAAYTFRLDNDKDADRGDNRVVTAEIHREAQAKLIAAIEEKYGLVHPVAGFKRLGLESLRWTEGAVVAAEEGDTTGAHIDAVEANLGQDRPIVLYVYTHDVAADPRVAAACYEFDADVLAEDGVTEQLDRCVSIRVQADDSLTRAVRRRYGIGSRSPQIIILGPDGKKLWARSAPDVRALVRALESACEDVAGSDK